MTPQSTGITQRRTVFCMFYSVLFMYGTPSCTQHRHTRERSSNRWWHMPTHSTIPNLLWRLHISCMRRFWGASLRVPGMGCLQARPHQKNIVIPWGFGKFSNPHRGFAQIWIFLVVWKYLFRGFNFEICQIGVWIFWITQWWFWIFLNHPKVVWSFIK